MNGDKIIFCDSRLRGEGKQKLTRYLPCHASRGDIGFKMSCQSMEPNIIPYFVTITECKFGIHKCMFGDLIDFCFVNI